MQRFKFVKLNLKIILLVFSMIIVVFTCACSNQGKYFYLIHEGKILKLTKNNIPSTIQRVGLFDFEVDEEKLWAMDLKTLIIRLDQLLWQLKLPFWHYNNTLFSLRPIDAIKNPIKYSLEYHRMLKAELKYPVNIIYYKNRWLILDGLHRVLKAYFLGQSTIEARIVPHGEMHKIINSNTTVDSFNIKKWQAPST